MLEILFLIDRATFHDIQEGLLNFTQELKLSIITRVFL